MCYENCDATAVLMTVTAVNYSRALLVTHATVAQLNPRLQKYSHPVTMSGDHPTTLNKCEKRSKPHTD